MFEFYIIFQIITIVLYYICVIQKINQTLHILFLQLLLQWNSFLKNFDFNKCLYVE